MSASPLRGFRRVVVKVGSSLLTRPNGEIDRDWIDGLASDFKVLADLDIDLLLVSSGAIAAGSRALGVERGRARLADLQAAAAAGQVRLAHAWQEALAKHGIVAAQILLTPGDTENRQRFLNARATLSRLLVHRAVPVINENDTVATEEIRYGDNDRLAARAAQLVMADALVLLSDIDGLYTADPAMDPGATFVPEVRTIDDRVVAMAGQSRSGVGVGGMATKLAAARIATHAGCRTIVASGIAPRPLSALETGARHTVFFAEGTPRAARKQWLAGALEVRGSLHIDAGACRALADGGSLLPVGVQKIEGNFQRGDVVRLVGSEQKELGLGLAEYSNEEAAAIAGCRSTVIAERLGYRGSDVMIHRDDLVWFDGDR